MKLSILLFATLKMKAGGDRLEIELPGESATAGEILKTAIEAKPQLATQLKSIIVAVNKEFASLEKIINEGDEVAFFPPVSGG